MQSPPPPVVDAANVRDVLRARGWAVVDSAAFASLIEVARPALIAWSSSWNTLPPDTWLKDGGHYRFRRHSCFVVEARSPGSRNGTAAQVPHRPHWQSVDYNALHGGLERWFEPVAVDVVNAPAWGAMLVGLGDVFSSIAKPITERAEKWFVEAHQFRIDCAQGIGRPTPEGAHRDGVDFVVVVLVGRGAVKGGETRVFDADGNAGVRFTLSEPWSALLLDDERVIHESTPIQPSTSDAEGAVRDTLVLTFRRGNFQGPGT